jgi:hypothetical protein
MGATQQVLASYGASFVGPLDAYTTALSVMLLPFRGLSGYTGNAFRVRDTTGDAEQNIGFDPVTGDLAAFTVGGNAAVRWWYDQSGDARNVPQATAAAQPFLTTNIVNGQPVARFDGTNDAMVVSWTGAVTERTLYVVARKRTAPTGAGGKKVVSLTFTNDSILLCDQFTTWGWAKNSSEDAVELAGSPSNWSIVAIPFTTSTAQVWTNNQPADSFTPWETFGDPYLEIGGSYIGYADADVAAVLIYDTAHGDTTRQAIQTILAVKFGITLA